MTYMDEIQIASLAAWSRRDCYHVANHVFRFGLGNEGVALPFCALMKTALTRLPAPPSRSGFIHRDCQTMKLNSASGAAVSGMTVSKQHFRLSS